jgi:hypothetical protein
MRNSVIALAVVACVVLPNGGSAKEATPLPPAPTEGTTQFRDQLSELLHQFGIGLIKKARAAECADEGETCKSNEQCCAGLECSGGPPATCTAED